jgi:hypothetical protein
MTEVVFASQCICVPYDTINTDYYTKQEYKCLVFLKEVDCVVPWQVLTEYVQ